MCNRALLLCLLAAIMIGCGDHRGRGSSFTTANGNLTPAITGQVLVITDDFASMTAVTIFKCKVRSQSSLPQVLARLSANLNCANANAEARYQLRVNGQVASSQSNYYRQNFQFNAYFAFKNDLGPNEEITVELVADFLGLRTGDQVNVYGDYIATNKEEKAIIAQSGGLRRYTGP